MSRKFSNIEEEASKDEMSAAPTAPKKPYVDKVGSM